MNDRLIRCATCHRHWPVSTQECTYLELDLMTRPCPHCEACTLSVVHKPTTAPRLPRRPAPAFPAAAR